MTRGHPGFQQEIKTEAPGQEATTSNPSETGLPVYPLLDLVKLWGAAGVCQSLRMAIAPSQLLVTTRAFRTQESWGKKATSMHVDTFPSYRIPTLFHLHGIPKVSAMAATQEIFKPARCDERMMGVT